MLVLFKKKKEIELLDDEETPKKVIENKIRVSILCMACFLFVIFGIYFATGTNVFHVVTKMVMNGLGVYTEEIPSISIESDDYDQAGSYHIEKSAKWIDTDRARVTFDVDSVIKQEGSSMQDVILVLDISGSMMGSKLEKAISDSKELASYLLSNKNNRFAIIAFDTNSTVVLPLTNNKDEVLMKLDELKVNGCTNYNAALMSVDTIMKDYVKEKGREVVTLFLTDGYPNIDTPNQVGTYALLKDKYPYMTINGIQYEMGKDIINEIKQITDQQFIADQTILNNVLFEATVTPVSYEKFVIADYIHDEYFYIETPDDIKVSIGKVKLEEENGIQKIIWDLEDYMTGRNATMEIDLTLKKKYIESRGYYPTNKKEVIESTLPKEETKKIESTKTPVLKNYYEVIYESNTPEGCHIDNSRKTHYIYENVTKNQGKLTCEGYLFKGWES